ncbi:hypothetical protein ACFXGR_23000 [Streptomyces mirabilis]|uniref:hypothetical protein n=1 Tax=Streptomyces mirabilis TaxID=68239 RepID=UPI0036C69542
MIPALDYTPDADIPHDASFWMPSEEDIPDDEGIGYFRNVWMLLNEPEDVTRHVIETESDLITLVDHLTVSVEEYEALATIIDKGYSGKHPPGRLGHIIRTEAPELLEIAADDELPLYDLELGVAGLSYALSTVGAVPVASCRGHEGGWSDQPVVFVALDEQRARWLQPLLRESGCGFHISRNREEFLVIDSPSIQHTNALAQEIVREFDGHTDLFDRWLDLSVIDARYN